MNQGKNPAIIIVGGPTGSGKGSLPYKIIDDFNNVTLLSASSAEKDIKSMNKINKTELSKIVAEKLAKKANEKKITKVYFDRSFYKYHGRVKVFAETLRKNGMKF